MSQAFAKTIHLTHFWQEDGVISARARDLSSYPTIWQRLYHGVGQPVWYTVGVALLHKLEDLDDNQRNT